MRPPDFDEKAYFLKWYQKPIWFVVFILFSIFLIICLCIEKISNVRRMFIYSQHIEDFSYNKLIIKSDIDKIQFNYRWKLFKKSLKMIKIDLI
jgi:hypothetical protein